MQKVGALRAKRRSLGALPSWSLASCGLGRLVAGSGVLAAVSSLALPASAQGFQDALGPGAESRALGGAVTAGASGAQASFANPAGLARAERPEVYFGMGLLGTNRTASPQGTTGPIGSEVELTPLPALSAALPLTEWLVLGAHTAPASFQGGAYRVDSAGASLRDARSFRMLEAGPELAFLVPDDVLPGALTFGASYRITAGALDRARAPGESPGDLGLDLSGADFASVRLGAQYSPLPELRFGLSWQSAVSIALGAESGRLAGVLVDQPQAIWTLPARLAVGARFDLDRYGVALEYRLVDYSGSDLTYVEEAGDGPITQRETGPLGVVHSGHLAAEMRLSRRELEFPIRVGLAIESVFGSSLAASPFEPPPAPLGSLSAGAGVQSRNWGGNIAIATRFGGGSVGDDDPTCDLCAQAGDVALYEWSLAADFVVRFGD